MYLGSLVGVSAPSFRGRDGLPDLAKFFHVGSLIRHTRNAEGLAAILEHFFRVPVGIQEFVGHWLSLGERERTGLQRDGAALGGGAVLGRRVWDRQHKFRIQVGPLSLLQYESLLPGGRLLGKLVDWVRMYFGFELEWDVRLLLASDEVPKLVLGRGGRLGWTTWVGTRREETAADDLCLDAEMFAGRGGVPAV